MKTSFPASSSYLTPVPSGYANFDSRKCKEQLAAKLDRPSLAICPISWGQSNITTSNSAPSFLARRALGSGSDGTYIITESSSHFQILLCALFVVVAVVAVSGTPASDSEGGDVSNNVEDESSQENLALLVS